jgi:hypothetical protein
MVLLAGWLVLGVAVAVRGLLRPLCQPLCPEALAALIEEKYPDLGERLLSAVELADRADRYQGSATLVALLLNETDARTRQLDCLEAFPVHRAARFAAAASGMLLLILLPSLLWPQAYSELSQRFFFPWRAVAAYTLEVMPGDAVVAKGRPLRLSVRVRPLKEAAALPLASTLIRTDADGTMSRLRMVNDGAGRFTLLLDRVTGDFCYQVEAGSAVSTTFQVNAVEPVELASGSPVVTITPPEYARTVIETQTSHGRADLSALEHSRVRLDFRFTRPAVEATLQFTATGGKHAEPALPLTPPVAPGLELTADRRSARVELPARADGRFKLLLGAEHGIRTEPELPALTVQVDQPPVFVQVTTNDRLREGPRVVLPYDSVPLDLTLADDVGVEQAVVEYRVNNGQTQGEPIPLTDAGTRQASGSYRFNLAGKPVQEGDVVHFRLKATDNRRVPEAGLHPHSTYHPPEGWLTLQVARKAEPLRQQEITAQRDAIQQRLEALKRDLLREQRSLYKLRQESNGQPALSPEQARALQQLRQDHQALETALADLARDSSESPALQPLADLAREVANGEMHRADQALHDAEQAKQPAARIRRLDDADQERSAALDRLEGLRRLNERLARERLDQLQLEMMAQRQQGLADRLAQDPVDRTRAERGQRDQNELVDELQRLAGQGEPLQHAVDAARAEQARELAAQARELARAQRALTEATRAKQPREQGDRLADLAQRQSELAGQTERLAQETRQPAQVARASPLQAEESQQAAEALQRGDAGEAAERQERAAADLERLAADLERAAEQARDPREAARQLARLQDGLRQRLKEDVKKSDPKVALARQLQDVQREQDALRRTLKQLPVDEQNPAVQKEHREAVQRAGQALLALHKPNVKEADARMNETRQALERLAERQPAGEPSAEPGPASPSEEPAARPQGLPDRQQADQARQLAQQQRALRDAAQRLARESAGQRNEPQQALQRQAADLSRDLSRLAQQTARSPQAQQAAASSRQAQAAMQQARDQARQGNQGQARQAQERAAQALDQAARQADQAGEGMASRQGLPTEQQAGQSLQQARGEMKQAQGQLAQGQDAQGAMRRAAQALRQAAGQLASRQGQGNQRSPESQTGPAGAPGSGSPDATAMAVDAKTYAGKPWGDLPGELRTKILQDVKAKYGDDYARIIKLYFEQLADTKKPALLDKTR